MKDTAWTSTRPTAQMRADFFTPWAHDRGRQTTFFEVVDADPRWHPLADRDIEREYLELTGRSLVEGLVLLEEQVDAARIRKLAAL